MYKGFVTFNDHGSIPGGQEGHGKDCRGPYLFQAEASLVPPTFLELAISSLYPRIPKLDIQGDDADPPRARDTRPRCDIT
ncbi:hypothetical protein SLA2020_312600 [Shorea laevis]